MVVDPDSCTMVYPADDSSITDANMNDAIIPIEKKNSFTKDKEKPDSSIGIHAESREMGEEKKKKKEYPQGNHVVFRVLIHEGRVVVVHQHPEERAGGHPRCMNERLHKRTAELFRRSEKQEINEDQSLERYHKVPRKPLQTNGKTI